MGLFCSVSIFRESRALQTLFSIFAGFLYGFIIACIDVEVYGMPQFWPYYISGLSFDLLHAIGNGGFYLLLTPVFQRLYKKTVKKRRLDC